MAETIKVQSTELYATLAQASKDITYIREWLHGSKDRIDEHIKEHLDSYDKAVKEALSDYENLSKEKLDEIRILYKKVVYPFDYAGENEPINPNLNETWFSTTDATIYKYIQNPKVTFIQQTRPSIDERKINDIWFKPDLTSADKNKGLFYLCEKVVESKAWINPALPENLEPNFTQENEPTNPQLGDIWKKDKEYFVYIQTTSGNAWTTPENPSSYTPTYEQENEPENANLGDIWKKGDEYFIYARVTSDNAFILKDNLNIKAYIWNNDEVEKITYINSLLKDFDTNDETLQTNKNQINDLKSELSTKEQELQELENEIKEALEQNPNADVSELTQKRDELKKELENIKQNIDTKEQELQKIEADKNLVNAKTLSETKTELTNLINTKVNLNADETINGTKTFSAVPVCNVAASANTHLVRKDYVDYGGGILNLGWVGSTKLDLSKAQHFYLGANANTRLGVANWGGAGKCGTITIENCQNITAFLHPFNFRLAQSGFSGTETFSYFCINSNLIRLVRS